MQLGLPLIPLLGVQFVGVTHLICKQIKRFLLLRRLVVLALFSKERLNGRSLLVPLLPLLCTLLLLLSALLCTLLCTPLLLPCRFCCQLRKLSTCPRLPLVAPLRTACSSDTSAPLTRLNHRLLRRRKLRLVRYLRCRCKLRLLLLRWPLLRHR